MIHGGNIDVEGTVLVRAGRRPGGRAGVLRGTSGDLFPGRPQRRYLHRDDDLLGLGGVDRRGRYQYRAQRLVPDSGGDRLSAPGTASICTSVDAHEDPGRRYIAGIANGVFYLIGGLFAGTIVLFFSIFPAQMIAMLAGLALIGAIASSLQVAFAERERMEAPLIAFMVTASGLEVFDIGAAFWGVAIGSVAHLMLHRSGLAGAGEPKGIV